MSFSQCRISGCTFTTAGISPINAAGAMARHYATTPGHKTTCVKCFHVHATPKLRKKCNCRHATGGAAPAADPAVPETLVADLACAAAHAETVAAARAMATAVLDTKEQVTAAGLAVGNTVVGANGLTDAGRVAALAALPAMVGAELAEMGCTWGDRLTTAHFRELFDTMLTAVTSGPAALRTACRDIAADYSGSAGQGLAVMKGTKPKTTAMGDIDANQRSYGVPAVFISRGHCSRGPQGAALSVFWGIVGGRAAVLAYGQHVPAASNTHTFAIRPTAIYNATGFAAPHTVSCMKSRQ